MANADELTIYHQVESLVHGITSLALVARTIKDFDNSMKYIMMDNGRNTRAAARTLPVSLFRAHTAAGDQLCEVVYPGDQPSARRQRRLSDTTSIALVRKKDCGMCRGS